MRRSSLNRFVPSRRRQITHSFHFPLIVANAVTRSEGSQSKRGLLTSFQNQCETKFATTPLAVAIKGISHFLVFELDIRVCLQELRCVSIPPSEVKRERGTNCQPFLSMPPKTHFVP